MNDNHIAKIAFFLIILCLTKSIAEAQSAINLTLKRKLDSIMVLDQKYREDIVLLMSPGNEEYLSKKYNVQKKLLNQTLWKKQHTIDSANIVYISAVIKRYGYPGKSLVGTPSNEGAYYVIQHSSRIEEYIKTIAIAAKRTELPFHLYAMMEDRFLMDNNKELIYGSQAASITLNGSINSYIIWPIKDPLHVNELRKKAGFELTVEQNAERLGVNYKVIRMSEINMKK
ncbi:hypothetical protein SNE25_24420 [Mucilaginibacter sabulilitoris]|uniref:Uncharacterized protein n=1 Tax=Mucilaginibacter sabulilitoris TaxID=1173583 RepID=A0ABZ0TH28_9SPHI|nr:hypothetical protein [Mucilaginibacter sabulilitoris]WPU92477.1 hypothetical protein SNE25_24420 [Mucilaginibacter sabulilitoris]